ncbi:DUF4189 domain-containing protein [Caulobacter sp. 73W]|uniref:DUF4189 domain-containing protein n=1 Tax=Caulobacter sp. 73W TaxID=3161137 RepID=A0AB39KW87_9CAUL
MRRTLILLVAVAALGTPAVGQHSRHQSIAYSPISDYWGVANGLGNLVAADAAAMGFCNRPDCRIVANATNACAAFATTADRRYAGGLGLNHAQAQANAVAGCNAAFGVPCVARGSIC